VNLPEVAQVKGAKSMTSEPTQETGMRDQVFISYSHEDAGWMKKFSAQLKVIQQTGRLDIWSDKRIKSGQNWQQEIDAAIARARVALLLATPDFFASEFIQNDELPKILKRHQEKGLFLFWVPIRYGAYPKSYLANIQAASDPEKPLQSLSEPEQDRIMSQIAMDIGEKLGQSVRVVGDARLQLMEDVRGRLKGRYEDIEEIGCGDTSIVFRGRQGLRDFGIKVLVSGGVSPSERETLRTLLRDAACLTDPAYIRVQDVFLNGDPICIVSEYITGTTLSHALHQRNRGLPPDEVVSYVRQLARALDEAHDKGLSLRKLLPSNLFLDGSRIRLSPLVLLLQANQANREHGTLYTTSEALNYISPEQYYGQPLGDMTDQYALGLIALSMLQGGPPVPNKQLADLANLPAFFDDPRKFFDKTWLDEAPGLSRVIARMLCKDPRQRWDSMAEILNAIEPLQRSQHRQEVHVGDAKRSYRRYCLGKTEFYHTFYSMFFRRSRATERLFANVTMERQYEMIDEAIERLLNFREGAEPTTLSRTRDAHRRFQLAPSDFDHFGDAFLEALKAMGERDPEVLDSWYAVLRPSLEYMKQECAAKPEPKAVRARKQSPEGENVASPTCTRPRTPSNAN
jgi:serine/threonine protein kinase